MKAVKLILESMGVSIDPNEIETAWANAKDALPKLAAAFEEMNQRQERLEQKMDRLLALVETPPLPEATFLSMGAPDKKVTQ